MSPRACSWLMPPRSCRRAWRVRPPAPWPASRRRRFTRVGALEGSDGLGLVVEDLEHEVQGDDGKDLVDRLGEHHQLDVPALRRRALLAGHELPETGRI